MSMAIVAVISVALALRALALLVAGRLPRDAFVWEAIVPVVSLTVVGCYSLHTWLVSIPYLEHALLLRAFQLRIVREEAERLVVAPRDEVAGPESFTALRSRLAAVDDGTTFAVAAVCDEGETLFQQRYYVSYDAAVLASMATLFVPIGHRFDRESVTWLTVLVVVQLALCVARTLVRRAHPDQITIEDLLPHTALGRIYPRHLVPSRPTRQVPKSVGLSLLAVGFVFNAQAIVWLSLLRRGSAKRRSAFHNSVVLAQVAVIFVALDVAFMARNWRRSPKIEPVPQERDASSTAPLFSRGLATAAAVVQGLDSNDVPASERALASRMCKREPARASLRIKWSQRLGASWPYAVILGGFARSLLAGFALGPSLIVGCGIVVGGGLTGCYYREYYTDAPCMSPGMRVVVCANIMSHAVLIFVACRSVIDFSLYVPSLKPQIQTRRGGPRGDDSFAAAVQAIKWSSASVEKSKLEISDNVHYFNELVDLPGLTPAHLECFHMYRKIVCKLAKDTWFAVNAAVLTVLLLYVVALSTLVFHTVKDADHFTTSLWWWLYFASCGLGIFVNVLLSFFAQRDEDVDATLAGLRARVEVDAFFGLRDSHPYKLSGDTRGAAKWIVKYWKAEAPPFKIAPWVTLNVRTIKLIRKSSISMATYLLSAALVSESQVFAKNKNLYDAVRDVPYLNAIVSVFYAG